MFLDHCPWPCKVYIVKPMWTVVVPVMDLMHGTYGQWHKEYVAMTKFMYPGIGYVIYGWHPSTRKVFMTEVLS